ncbi:MAG: sulfatase-like hydrolase/transferase [Rhodoferax sp.]|nr:sulfatase-like hydrolase/transferase [Rhodoferax sp.]
MDFLIPVSRPGWAASIGLIHVALVLLAGYFVPLTGQVSSVLVSLYFPQAWLAGALLGGLAWLIWRWRWIIWGASLLANLYVATELPAAMYFGRHVSAEMLREGLASPHLLNSALAELNLPFYLLMAVCLGVHGWMARALWNQRTAREAIVAPGRRRLAGATLASMALIGALGLAVGTTAAPQHPLLYLLRSSADDDARLTAPAQERPVSELPTVPDNEAALFAALPSRPGTADGSMPNIVLIVLESTGALQVAPDGKLDAKVTPHLASLHQAGGVLFDAVYVNFPGTLPANIALNTGGHYPTWTSPSTVVQRPWQGPLLARDLAKAGYRTGLFAAADLTYLGLDRFLVQANYDRFVHFGNLPKPDMAREKLDSWGGRDDLMAQRAISWAVPANPAKKPFFLQFMSNAPHHPYSVPESFGQATGNSRLERYKHALSYADQAVGRIVSAIKQAGLQRNTVFVITGDHGDSFGEHGSHGHRESGYDEAVRSFALIALPPGRVAMHRSQRIAALDHIYPTIMALARPIPDTGDSLLSPTWRTGPRFFQYKNRPGAWGVRDGNWKYLAQPAGEPKLFDLSNDPFEKNNLAGQYPERLRRYEDHCARWYVERDKQFLSLQQGASSAAGLNSAQLKEPGLKHLLIGYGMATGDDFRVVQADAFNPRERLFVESVWLGATESAEAVYVWTAPDGTVTRQTMGLSASMQTRREPAHLPLPMQAGTWSLQALLDGKAVGRQQFRVLAENPLHLNGDPVKLIEAARAKLLSLSVGEMTQAHQVVERHRFAPTEGFVIRSHWLPGLMDEPFEYVLVSPKGQQMPFPFILLPDTVKLDRQITPPVPMWQGNWTVRLQGAQGLLAETVFLIEE